LRRPGTDRSGSTHAFVTWVFDFQGSELQQRGDGSGFVISPFGWNSFDGCGLAVDTNNNFYMYVYGFFIGDGGALKPSSWLVKFNASGGVTRAANLYADDKTILTGISINQDNRIFVTGITYSSVLYGMVNPKGAKFCTFQMKVDRDF
jgi:hypothetical protein